jgi:hypothetical protein
MSLIPGRLNWRLRCCFIGLNELIWSSDNQVYVQQVFLKVIVIWPQPAAAAWRSVTIVCRFSRREVRNAAIVTEALPAAAADITAVAHLLFNKLPACRAWPPVLRAGEHLQSIVVLLLLTRLLARLVRMPPVSALDAELRVAEEAGDAVKIDRVQHFRRIVPLESLTAARIRAVANVRHEEFLDEEFLEALERRWLSGTSELGQAALWVQILAARGARDGEFLCFASNVLEICCRADTAQWVLAVSKP